MFYNPSVTLCVPPPLTQGRLEVGEVVLSTFAPFLFCNPSVTLRVPPPLTQGRLEVGEVVLSTFAPFYVLQPLRHATRATSPYTGEAESGGGCVIPLRHHSGKGGNENYTSLYL